MHSSLKSTGQNAEAAENGNRSLGMIKMNLVIRNKETITRLQYNGTSTFGILHPDMESNFEERQRFWIKFNVEQPR